MTRQPSIKEWQAADSGLFSQAVSSAPLFMERMRANVAASVRMIRRGRLIRSAIVFAYLFSIENVCRGQDATGQTQPDSLTGGWNSRIELQNTGIIPFAVLTDEVWGNAAGGLKTGLWWDQLLDFGVGLDTAKLGWWPGGSFMVQFHWLKNKSDDGSFADDTGAANPVSSIMAADHFRVFNLYYRQAWKDDTFAVKFGQLAADDDFMHSDYAGLFLNSAFGAMPSQVGTRLAACCHYRPPFPIWPVAGPGLFLAAKPSDKFYAQVGVYDGQPGPDSTGNHGFDWENDSRTGVGVFYEGGYSYAIAKHPGTVRLGGTYHSGLFDDYARINAGVSDAAARGVYSFYAINDFALLTDAAGKPVVGLFWRGGISPQTDRSIVTGYTDAGFNWFAPLPGRKDDIAGAAVSHTEFGNDFRQADGAVASSETTLELTYKAQITRWMTMQADMQFLFNPAANPGAGSRETAIVLGLRAQITF